EALRIPVEYLANLFTAGATAPVEAVLRRLAAMRSYMRDINLGRDPQASIPEAVGMTEEEMYEMFRLLAIAKYGDRYVIPSAHGAQAHALEELATDCPVTSYDDELMETSGPFGEGSGRGVTTPVAVENLRMLQQRQTGETLVAGGEKRGRVNLLNWDGRGVPRGMFPDRGADQAPAPG